MISDESKIQSGFLFTKGYKGVRYEVICRTIMRFSSKQKPVPAVTFKLVGEEDDSSVTWALTAFKKDFRELSLANNPDLRTIKHLK